MVKSRTRMVPLGREPTEDMFSFEIVDRKPDGSLEVSLTMGMGALELFQRVVAGDGNIGLQPVELVDLLARAKIGDHGPLIRHFEEGGAVTDDERRVIGALARGAWPAPQNCPPKIETKVRGRDVARFAAVLKLMGGKRVADIAAAKFGVDRSYVTKQMKKYSNREGWSAFIMEASLQALGADQTTARKAMFWYANVTEADIVEATESKSKRRAGN